jgi:Amt family ammonium transporter
VRCGGAILVQLRNHRAGALSAALVLAMHAGFAFLELGTVRKKNQVNALVKFLVAFSGSTVAYFFGG